MIILDSVTPKYMVHRTTGHLYRYESEYLDHPDWKFFTNYWLACGYSLRTWDAFVANHPHLRDLYDKPIGLENA